MTHTTELPQDEQILTIRKGDQTDAPHVLEMLDLTVEWLVAMNRQDQWGTEPWSADPRNVQRVNQMIEDADLWIAEVGKRIGGGLIVSDEPMPYIEAATEPELYI